MVEPRFEDRGDAKTVHAMLGALGGARARDRWPSAFLPLLRERGIEVSWRVLAQLGGHLELERIPSQPFLEFMLAAVARFKGPRLLDPWADAGVLLSALTTEIEPSSALGLIREASLHEIAEAISHGTEWLVGDPVQLLIGLQRAAFASISSCALQLGASGSMRVKMTSLTTNG